MLLYPKDRGATAVIITCHNYERFIEESLISVLEQDALVDIVVVNDAPSDPQLCRDIVKGYPNTRVFEVNFNSPLLARRYGYEQSRSEYIVFLDADDRLGSNYINDALSIIGDNGIVYSDMQYFGTIDTKTDYASNIDKSMICLTNFIHVGSMVKRKLIDISNAFDHPQMKSAYHEDWLFWRRIITNTNCDITKQTSCYEARKHADNRSDAIRSLPYYESRGTSGDTITLCCINPDKYVGRLSKHIDWPYDQLHEILPDRNVKTQAASFSYAPNNYKHLIINHVARTAITDYVLFYNDDEHYMDVCNHLLRHMDHKRGIVHDTRYEMLECTMVATMLLYGKHYGEVDEFKKENIKYV